MTKKTARKSHRVTARNRTKKKSWLNALPLKFSVISVTILGCLTLIVGGVYHSTSHGGVLAAGSTECIYVTTDPKTGEVKCEYGFTTGPKGFYTDKSGTKCVPNSSVETLDVINNTNTNNACASSTNRTLHIKVVNASNGKPVTLFSGVGIHITVSTAEVPSQTITINSKSNTNGIIQFNGLFGGYTYNDAVTISASGEKGGIYSFSIPHNTWNPAFSNDCGDTSNKACVVQAKIIALPVITKICKTTNSTTCVGSKTCTKISSSCNARENIINCHLQPGSCGVPAKCSQDKGAYCVPLQYCKGVGGTNQYLPGCSSGQICCK